jgi:hypothetical protein
MPPQDLFMPTQCILVMGLRHFIKSHHFEHSHYSRFTNSIQNFVATHPCTDLHPLRPFLHHFIQPHPLAIRHFNDHQTHPKDIIAIVAIRATNGCYHLDN